MEIRGRVALVTGASSGIGRATAIDLARRGATVAICARRADRLEETLRECQNHAPSSRSYLCDVREREQIRVTIARARADLGPIDILINNAGIGAYHLFTEAPEEQFEELMRANYFSALYFTREVMLSMVERRTGTVVFVSSFAGRIATWRHTAYSASKFAVTGLAEALYYEVKSRGVHVAVIYPGAIRTELFDKRPGFEHLRHVVEPQLLGTRGRDPGDRQGNREGTLRALRARALHDDLEAARAVPARDHAGHALLREAAVRARRRIATDAMKLRKLSSGISVEVFVVASSVTMVPLSRSVIVVLTVFMRFPWIIVVRVTVLAPPWAPGIVICWSITTAAVAMASSATSV